AAVRDALLASETLQQMVGHLAGEDDAPMPAFPVLERMHAWAVQIGDDSVDDYAPEPVALATPVQTVATQAPIAEAPQSGSDASTLRVGSEHLGKLVHRAGQALASSQRTARTLRDIEERLNLAQERQPVLRTKLEELQRTVDRQVVALQETRDQGGSFDPLEMDRYDSLHILSRSIAEALQDQTDLTLDARAQTNAAIAQLRDDQRELREQPRDLLTARLVAFRTLVPRMRRSVAQTASETGKRVRLVMHGDHVTVDADVLSRLTEPLLHMLRNAIDHGIESADERLMLGKDAEGVVELICSREGQNFVLTCRDDGRGIDAGAVYERAIREGLIAPEAQVSEAQIHALILQRGFSTKEEVSQISGRGIGMDVVADRIRSMKGTLAIASSAGRGTTFTMRVPVSGGIAQSLVVRVAGQTVAVPSDSVFSIAPMGSVEPGATQVRFADEDHPIYSLATWLGFAEPAEQVDYSGSPILIAYGNTGRIGLAVDQVLDVRELVLQDVGGLLRRVSGLSVGSLGDAGTP
ncbi:MAG: chemotaxis protein CheA, partial [Casimicrobium sp.]